MCLSFKPLSGTANYKPKQWKYIIIRKFHRARISPQALRVGKDPGALKDDNRNRQPGVSFRVQGRVYEDPSKTTTTWN